MRRSYLGCVLLVLLLGCEVLLASLGPAVQMVHGHDVVVFLDAAWRVQQGQIPFQDIKTDVGALTILLLALLAGSRAVTISAYVAYSMLLTAVVAVWGWLLGLRRLNPYLALAACGSLMLLTAGVYNQGDPYSAVTYAMSYNRFGYACLFLMGLELFSPPPEPTRRELLWGGASTGFLLAALLFVKITYLVTACGFIVLRLLALGVPARRWWLGASLGAGACLAPLLTFLRFNVSGILDNQFRMALHRTGTGGYNHPQRLHDGIINVSPFLVCLVLLWWLLPRPRGREGLMTLGLLIASVALAFTNYSEFGLLDLPLGLLVALLLMERHVRAGSVGWLALGLALVVGGPFFYRNLASLGVAYELKRNTAPQLARFDSGPLHTLLIVGPSGLGNGPGVAGENTFYVNKLNDGFQLLRQHSGPTDRVASFTFENPFPLALGMQSPRGLPISWDYGANFSKEMCWPPEQVLGDATLIMVPALRETQASKPLLSIYGDYLVKNFTIKAQSAAWILLQRKAP